MHPPSLHADHLILASQVNSASIRGLFRAEAGKIVRSTKPHDEFRGLRGVIERAHGDAAAALAGGVLVEDYQRARARLANGVLSGVLHVAQCKAFEYAHGSALPLSAVAIGGYGRQQLAPASDLDVLFLLPERNGDRSRAEEMLAFAIPAIWDLGFRLDHFILSLAEYRELTNSDVKIRASHLDTRLVWGCPGLYHTFLQARDSLPDVTRATLVSQLLEEARRREGNGPSHSTAEPNLKFGPGALRDIQSLHWLALLRKGKPICDPETLAQISTAAGYLSRVRCFLHLLTVRQQDQLTRDLQAVVASRLGFDATDDKSGEHQLLALVRHYTATVRKVIVRLCQETEFLAAHSA